MPSPYDWQQYFSDKEIGALHRAAEQCAAGQQDTKAMGALDELVRRARSSDKRGLISLVRFIRGHHEHTAELYETPTKGVGIHCLDCEASWPDGFRIPEERDLPADDEDPLERAARLLTWHAEDVTRYGPGANGDLAEEAAEASREAARALRRLDLSGAEREVLQRDLSALLRALDLGTHARDATPHEVIQDEILPEVREAQALRAKVQGACDVDPGEERDALDRLVQYYDEMKAFITSWFGSQAVDTIARGGIPTYEAERASEASAKHLVNVLSSEGADDLSWHAARSELLKRLEAEDAS